MYVVAYAGNCSFQPYLGSGQGLVVRHFIWIFDIPMLILMLMLEPPPTRAYDVRPCLTAVSVLLRQDDSLAAHNLTLVAAHLYMAGSVDAGLLFSLLDFLTDRRGGVVSRFTPSVQQ